MPHFRESKPRVTYLQQNIVDGHLQFETERVTGVLTIQYKLIVDVEAGDRGDCGGALRCLLVLFPLTHDLLLQLLKVSPDTEASWKMCMRGITGYVQ